MLNVNAKSFVPPGADTLPQPLLEGVYRYSIDVPPRRMIDFSNNAKAINGISSLLASKYLFADRNPRTPESLQYFLDQAFLSATNMPTGVMSTKLNSGFLLSKSMLALYSDIAVINAVNEAPGFLLHLDLPREFGAEVNVIIGGVWEALYNRFIKDFRVSAFGYSRSVVGLNHTQCGGSYRHYFYVACNSAQELDAISVSAFADLEIPLARITPVSSIVPYVCGSRAPLAVFVTIGDEAKEAAFPDDSPAGFEFELHYYPGDYASTFASFEKFECYYAGILSCGHRWEKTTALNLHIKMIGDASVASGVPIWDVLVPLGNLCDNTGACVVGISFSSAECVPGSVRILALNPDGPFYVKATLAEMTEKQVSLDTTHTPLGSIPLAICGLISRNTADAASRALREYFPVAQKRLSDTQQLTRMNFAEAADLFAKNRFFARRRAIGTPVLFGTDSANGLFGVDLKTGSVFACTSHCDGCSGLLRDCLFLGTLCSVHFGELDYRLIIEDIVTFQNTNVRHLPFLERWRFVEKMDLDDEEAWPHSTPSHLVVLRAGYVPFERTDFLVNMPPTGFASKGIAFVNDFPNAVNEVLCPQFYWDFPASLTVKFAVGRIESVTEGGEDLRRLFLAVANDVSSSGEAVLYEGEYADVSADVYAELSVGDIVECILCRAEDGAHWWDVVRDFKSGTATAARFAHVDQLVHSPGITKSEMLWLLKAPSYQCDRCRKVNDAGRYNAVRNVYWCNNCWRETGHGECSYCNRTRTAGMVDSFSKLFYCGTCWTNFSSPNKQADIGYLVPPRPSASFTQQVATRCVSLLIDYLSPKCPTNDVLDLCCGGSVLRKWMRNKTMRYVGIDLKASVVDAATEVIISSEDERPTGARYEVVCADVFSPDFWTQTIPKIHPRQFHTVSCFAGLHHAFGDEERARRFVGSIANALVPGGIFIGFSTDSSVLYSKGLSFENAVIKVEWGEDAVPRIGNTFNITVENGRVREENVIPIDFLIAVASEYGMEVISEACLTFRELIEKDGKWTKVPSADEKEYLCALRTFGFKKVGSEQAPAEVKPLL